MKIFFVINFITFIFNHFLFANSGHRVFKAVEGGEEIHLQEYNDIENYFLFMIRNSSLPENKIVYLFKGENLRYYPLNESVSLIFFDSKRKTVVKGGLKTEMVLTKLKKNLSFYEIANSKQSTPNLAAIYKEQEGLNQNKDENLSLILQTSLKKGCDVSIKVNIDNNFLVSRFKTIPAANGLADLCKDMDYKSAMGSIKTINFKSTKDYKTPSVKVNQSTLTVDLGQSSENTSSHIKALAENAF